MPDEQRDVIEILTADHREVEAIFVELERTIGATDDATRKHRKQLLDRAIIELVRHSVAEETEVYPRIRDRVSDAEAEQARHEHAEAEHTMKLLDGLKPGDAMFDKRLATLIDEIRAHVAEEEGEMFPQLRDMCSPDELRTLGAKVQRIKAIAPTRPHPAAPHQPPANRVVGPITGLFDRMRDAISGRGSTS
jgi:hemerythrin superfamily protein